MASWESLVLEEDSLDVWPEPAVARFLSYLYATFGDKPLKLWDLGCGRGRHTMALASLGLEVYASDYAQAAIDITQAELDTSGLNATLACSDMHEFPFEENAMFNGVVCWNVLQHTTYERARKTVQLMTEHVVPGGCVLLAVGSTSSQGYDKGERVEEGSYILDCGREKGVLHHFFTAEEIRELFDERHWALPAFAENLVLYHTLDTELADPHMFRSTGWLVLAQRK